MHVENWLKKAMLEAGKYLSIKYAVIQERFYIAFSRVVAMADMEMD